MKIERKKTNKTKMEDKVDKGPEERRIENGLKLAKERIDREKFLLQK